VSSGTPLSTIATKAWRCRGVNSSSTAAWTVASSSRHSAWCGFEASGSLSGYADNGDGALAALGTPAPTREPSTPPSPLTEAASMCRPV
jgi:hypothetical protein